MRRLLLTSLITMLACAPMCQTAPEGPDFAIFEFEGEVTFSFEYPDSWSVDRGAVAVRFSPSRAADGYIELVVYDPLETPPLPVYVTYDTLRVVDSLRGQIAVLVRDPAAVTERYVAMVGLNSHVAEFRSYAEREYDAVFDHMLVTLNRTNSPEGGHHE